MPELHSTEVFFRAKEADRDWMCPFVDILLITWMGCKDEDRSVPRRILRELREYKTSMDKKKYSERESPFAAFFREESQQIDLSSMMMTLRHGYKSVLYTPDLEIGRELDRFLLEHIDEEEWRENHNRVWELSEEDITFLFRLMIWTIRQLELIAVDVTEQRPKDIGLRNLLAALRSFAYKRTLTLAPYAVNPDNFYGELGPDQFCPDKTVVAFWTGLGYNLTTEMNVHPIDRKLRRKPRFIELLDEISALLKKESALHHVAPSRRAAALSFLDEIKRTLETWNEAMSKLFHLGPTITLLRNTEAVLKGSADWLKPSKTPSGKADDSTGEAYASAFQTTADTFCEHSAKLSAALTAALAPKAKQEE